MKTTDPDFKRTKIGKMAYLPEWLEVESLSDTYGPSYRNQQYLQTRQSIALRRFHVALAGRNSAPCDIWAVGDSITAGYSATLRANRWMELLTGRLRAKFIQTAAGGPGYAPASIQQWSSGNWSDSLTTNGGGTTTGTGYGVDQKTAILNGAGHSRTWSWTGTGATFTYNKYNGGGTFTYTVDGGAPVTVNTTATPANVIEPITISGLTAGAHTIVVAWVSGTVFINGAMLYNGDATSGIRGLVAAQSGTQSAFWNDPAHFTWVNSATLWAPDLVIIELGPNDYSNPTPVAVAAYKANLLNIIANLKTKAGYSPSFVLMPVWALEVSGANVSVAPWTDYIKAMYEIADADPDNVCVLDMFQRVNPGTPSTAGGILVADKAHPGDVGNSYIADVLVEFLSPR